MNKLKQLTKLVVLFLSTLLLINCETKNGITAEEDSAKITQLKVSDFNKIGKIHNSFLTNVKDNFTVMKSITNEQEKIEFISQFNKNFVASIDISVSERNLLIADLDRAKDLVKEDILITKSFGDTFFNKSSERKDNEENIFEVIENLKTDGKIDDESYRILNSLSNNIKANYEGTLSDNQLKSNVQGLIRDFNYHGYSENSDGEMVGTILAISISSIEWWEENPDALDNLVSKSNSSNKSLIVPWVAADLVGAVLGGVVGATASYAGTGSVNWTSVGVSALGGAIIGSTGAIGKIARWFF